MVQKLYKEAFLIFFFSANCWAGVAVNPFLRPGSNSPPPKVEPPPPPPKPLINPSIAQEVEFRGYFLLKGIPHFCIFNKKANLGEWIKLSEKTYEEFEAQAFDLQSETLTLAFNGQNFTLTLMQSKSSPATTPSTPALPKVNLPPGMPSTNNSRVMPPKPKATPQMPDWLANRISSRPSSRTTYPSSSGGLSPTSSSQSLSPSTRFAPPSRNSSAISRTNNENAPSVSPNISSTSTSSRTFSPTSNLSRGSSSGFSPSSSSNVNSSGSSSPVTGNISPPASDPSPLEDDGSSENREADLEDLPPPPPPPNILPPSPPPDIVPSLDE